MATESGRAVTEEQEELRAPGAVSHAAHRHAHTRSQSHIQIHPLTHATQQWQQAPRAVAHTRRSHSHNHFSAASHTQPQKYGCRLTHSLSAMTKGERAAHGPPGKLLKPTEPLFPKAPQQVRSSHLFLMFFFFFQRHLLCLGLYLASNDQMKKV